jgi:photosystem II stability/assembly factor-like uncharacterized protein
MTIKNYNYSHMKPFLSSILLLIITSSLSAQKNKPTLNEDNGINKIVSALSYRSVGPYRGGRSAAVAGSFKTKTTFYMGSTGGGVWKTTDGGGRWKNISAGYFGSSIGAIAVAPTDESVIYVGEGENTMRGNVSEGLGGMWRSDDGGRSWKNIGLKDGRHIIRIVIHPKDVNTVWVAVMGHLFGPNQERGIFKTTDGGKNWKRVLFINEQTGCSDLVMEPGNPNVFYAGMWRVIRTPYSLESGGEGSGLYKSVDGGETWTNVSAKKGLPKGSIWGIVGVAFAPSNTQRIYSIIENNKGGLYRSDDGGESWQLMSSDNNIRQRAWYYTKVFVDPKNQDVVYCPNVGLMKSKDGGKSFQTVPTPHGDHHDLWIDPEDGNRMIVGDDGGAQVSFDGGAGWSTYMNQPTGQFYRVSTDNSFPYRILGAQQDNSTIRIKSRTDGAGITEQDWDATAGSESGYVVSDPLNPDIVYGGNYGGYLSRLDHRTGENRAINVWPDNPMGAGADALKYRFQWNFPIFFSPHNPKKLYAAGNVLFATEDEGQSWKALSGDLTTNDKTKQQSSGGPITKDNTSVEYYCTIFTATESTLEKDLLWVGSDDGLIHVSKDGGKNWQQVTPTGCPPFMMWNSVEVDPFKKGAAYFVGTRYKLDDFLPYIYKTEDYGKSWKRIITGIPSMHFVRALRADKRRAGLLYAGTEYGMYVSFDDGLSWTPFQLNLPVVPITDLVTKDNALVVATQGRGFYVLDDLSILQQYDPVVMNKPIHVFQMEPVWRYTRNAYRSWSGSGKIAGENPPDGASAVFWIKQISDTTSCRVSVLDKNQKLIRNYGEDEKNKPEWKTGMNHFTWDLRYPDSEKEEGMILWNGVPSGLTAPPGKYFFRIKAGNDSAEVSFEIKANPNYSLSQEGYDQQFQLLKEIQQTFNEVQKAIKDVRDLRSQIQVYTKRLGEKCPKELQSLADTIVKELTSIEESCYQTKAKSSQDVLNYPIRLNDKLSGLFDVVNSGVNAPSKQSVEVFDDLKRQAREQMNRLNKLKNNELIQLNQLIRQKELPIIGNE